MHYQLVNVIVADDGRKAIVAGVNVAQQTTTMIEVDISTDTPIIKQQRVLNKICKIIWAEADGWNYIEKDSNKWNAVVTHVKSFWDLRVAESKVLDIEIFDYVARRSPSGKYLALGTFRDKKVKVFLEESMKEIGSLNVENSYYAQGINFSNDSSKIGFIAFGQGGGNILYAEYKEGNFVTVFDAPQKQINDDYLMTGAVSFDGDDLIATTIYAGVLFSFVKYDRAGNVIWETKADQPAEGVADTEEQTDAIWNQTNLNVVYEGKLYTGAGRKILVLDTKTGTLQNEITSKLPGFIHQVIKVPNTDKLLAVDIYGTVDLVKI
jgi:hypothetical protein